MNNPDLFSIFNSLDDENESKENYVRGPFNYVGSKDRSIPYILPLLPNRTRYCEPFGGSGAVLLARRESQLEVFNDRCSGITNFYRCIRDSVKLDVLLQRLDMTLHGREEFVWCKETWDDKNINIDDVERAARWYYMIQMSFGSRGVSFGRTTKTIVCRVANKIYENLSLFYPCHNRLRRVQIENLDYRQCFKDFDHEDMVWYLDPPYYKSVSAMKYSSDTIDHKELLERAFYLKGFVAISSYDNELYNSYDWSNIHKWPSHVTITSQANEENSMKRGDVMEYLYIKE